MGLESFIKGLSDFEFELITSVLKLLILVAVVVQLPPIMIWLERRAPALMQRRKGPNRVGLFGFRLWGLLQSAADAIKLIFKEESVPDAASKPFFHLAPVLGIIPALLALSAVPFGPPLQVFDRLLTLQITHVNVGFLFILAVSGMAIYSVVLAGWASGNKFSLLGSLRASAQMVSYEIPMGLSLIPIVLLYGSLDLNEIVAAQGSTIFKWGIFCAPLSFVIFLITMFAETNRPPFDLAEGESELVAGFHTEFGSTKFALFYLSEYANMFMLSTLCSILFFGGWQLPFIPFTFLAELLGHNLAVVASVLTLLLKAFFFMWLFVWVRWTIPRFRYDQLMKLGWRFLLPLGLGNIVITALILSFTF